MDVRPKKLPLIKLLDYVHATFRPLTLDRGLDFEVSVGEDVPREMYSDEQRLQQILRNLLSNAIKFTATGRVELRVNRGQGPRAPLHPREQRRRDRLRGLRHRHRHRPGETPGDLRGVPAGRRHDQPQVRRHGPRPVHQPGDRGPAGRPHHRRERCPAGVHLHAVRAGRQPRARGDRARAPRRRTALPEQLSTEPFTAHDQDDSWPTPTKLEAWKAGRAGQVLPGRRVLIVDDDIRNVFALTHVLGRVGMPVLYAENGREGIETLERNPDVELVLMDIMMPEMDGYETISAIRRTPRWTGLPIVALTAKAMPGDREKSIARGANDYVPKPVDVDQLLTVVCALLDPESTDAEEQGLSVGPVRPSVRRTRTRRYFRSPPSSADDRMRHSQSP
jgi:CheY-like chemotaxis protein